MSFKLNSLKAVQLWCIVYAQRALVLAKCVVMCIRTVTHCQSNHRYHTNLNNIITLLSVQSHTVYSPTCSWWYIVHSDGRCSDIYVHCPQSEGDHDNIQLSTPSGLHTASADGIWYVPVSCIYMLRAYHMFVYIYVLHSVWKLCMVYIVLLLHTAGWAYSHIHCISLSYTMDLLYVLHYDRSNEHIHTCTWAIGVLFAHNSLNSNYN